jgi:serine/threonine protein kinase
VRNNTCCPTFLFANAGPWFAILGAVFTDKVIVQRLTDFIWVGMSPTLNEMNCDRVARIMNSLRMNVHKLRDYYRGLKVIAVGANEIHPRFFPSVRAYRDAKGEVVDFKYIEPLELNSTCVTFLAQTLGDSPKSVVVKFVERYGADAHRILAKANLAPELLYFGKIGVQDGDPSYGHLRMVVMQYIYGIKLDELQRHWHEEFPATLKAQIQLALKHLHDNGFVFGDLRAPNIMITENGEIKLIDFDWAGVHGKSQYPLLLSPILEWPANVKGSSVMETWHDNDMLTRLFRTK